MRMLPARSMGALSAESDSILTMTGADRRSSARDRPRRGRGSWKTKSGQRGVGDYGLLAFDAFDAGEAIGKAKFAQITFAERAVEQFVAGHAQHAIYGGDPEPAAAVFGDTENLLAQIRRQIRGEGLNFPGSKEDRPLAVPIHKTWAASSKRQLISAEGKPCCWV